MSVWSKLFGGSGAKAVPAPALVAPSPGAPATILAIPGKLTIWFYAHAVVEGHEGNFISAVTRGLYRLGQAELVLTLRLAASDDALTKMAELSQFFATVHAWASQRQLTDAGGLTQFGARGLFGRSRSGILYVDARPMPGVEIPSGALAALLVDAAEVRTASDFGAYRVLTRLGARSRHFPWPIWSELDRPSVVGEREHESVLAKIARARVPGVSFVVEDERVRILLSSGARAPLGRGFASLSPGAPLALLVKPAVSANALLVWHPGQKDAATISPDGADASRSSGSCLLIAPGGKDDQTGFVEDGYSLQFSSKSWALISAALLEHRPLSLPMAGGIRLSVEWLPESPAGAAD